MTDRIVDKYSINAPAGASKELRDLERDLNRILSRISSELPVRRIDEADLSDAPTTPYRLAIVPDSDDGATLAFFDTENNVWIPLQKQDAQLIALAALASTANLVTLANLASVANLSTLANLPSVANLSTLAGLASVSNLSTLAGLASVANLSTLANLGSVANLSTLAGLSSIVNLTGLAGLTSAANKLAYFTGAGGASAIADFNPTRVAFTPTYFGATTAGTTTYTTQTGSYMRLGGAVMFALQLTWTAVTGTGAGRIGGLPVSGGVNSPVSVYYTNLTHTAGRQLEGLINNSTEIALFACDPGGGGATQPTIDAAGEIRCAGVYFV